MADASYDKSLWFERQQTDTDAPQMNVSELAVLLAEEDHQRFVQASANDGGAAAVRARGRGKGAALTRREAESLLHSGVDPDSEVLKGPVKHVAARVNSVIAAAFLLVKKERERAHASDSAAKESKGETRLLLDKLEAIERERHRLLVDMAELRETQAERDREVGEREQRVLKAEESLAHLASRERKVQELEVEQGWREREMQVRGERIRALEIELEAYREKERRWEEEDLARKREEQEKELQWNAEQDKLRESEREQVRVAMTAEFRAEIERREQEWACERKRERDHTIQEENHLKEVEEKLLSIQVAIVLTHTRTQTRVMSGHSMPTLRAAC